MNARFFIGTFQLSKKQHVAAYSLGMEIIKHFFYVLGEPPIFRSMNRRINEGG